MKLYTYMNLRDYHIKILGCICHNTHGASAGNCQHPMKQGVENEEPQLQGAGLLIGACKCLQRGVSLPSGYHVRRNTCVYTYTDMCIHTYMHTYIHTYRHTYIHIHTHTYTYTYIHILTHTYTYIHTYIQIHTHTYTYIHTHMNKYLHTYIHTYIHKYASMHIQNTLINININIHINIYIYICMHIGVSLSSRLNIFGLSCVIKRSGSLSEWDSSASNLCTVRSCCRDNGQVHCGLDVSSG